MKDHAIPTTEADDPIELYLPLVEEELFWPAPVEVDEEEEQEQQQSYASYETVDAAVGDDRYPITVIDETHEYMPQEEIEQQQQPPPHQRQNLVSLVNDCVRAIDELCLFSDQLRMKIDALEAKMEAEAEEDVNED